MKHDETIVAHGTDKKHKVSKLKRGWNWKYTFCAKVLSDGNRKTLLVEHVLCHRKYGTDVVISGYPGAHHYENIAAEEVCEAFRNFFQDANEEGVAWQEVRECRYLTAWLIDAPIESGIVRSFAATLAAINRVTVETKSAGEVA